MGRENHFYGPGISIGIALGLLLGLMLDNIAIGFSLGAALGALGDYYKSRKSGEE